MFAWTSGLTYLIAVVRPRRPLHITGLDVEREKFDVDVARRAVDTVTQPHDFPRVRHDHVRVNHGGAVLRIRAVTRITT